MDARKTEPVGGGRRHIGSSETNLPAHATAILAAALRWNPWSHDEVAALARRRARAELARRHLNAAVAAWRDDMPACRWHIERMTAFKAARRA